MIRIGVDMKPPHLTCNKNAAQEGQQHQVARTLGSA